MSNLLKKLNPTNSSLYEKVEAQVKQASYSIMHELLQRQINSLFFFLILVVIEGFQLLWFSLHPNFSFLWTTSFVDYYRLVLKYLQADSFLLDGDQGFYFAFLYIAGVVQVSMIVCVIFVLTRPEKIRKKPSSLLDYVYRYMSIYCLLVKTIAPLPFFETFLFAIICTDNDPLRSPGTCYTGVHLFNLAVGIIGFISLLIFSFATQLLYIDLNPYSNILFASPHPRLELLKLFLKLAVPLYIVLDPTLEDAKAFVVIYVICWIVILTLRYNLQAYYNGIVSLFCISVEGIVFWAVSVANFHAFLDSGTVDAIGLVYYLIGIPFVMYTYAMILNLKRHQIMKKDSKTFKKPREIELYINILCQALEQREHPIKRVQLEGLLRYHMKYCNNRGPDCPCQLITAMLPRKEENPESLNLWHSFIKVRIIEALEMFPKSQRLHLQYAYFQKERLKNKFRALFELMIADENEPGVQQQFSIYRYKRLIEKEMLDEEHRNITGKVADITQIVEFQDKLVTLQNDIGKTVVGQLEFWRELEQANPNIQKLLSLGEKVTIQIENIKLAYGKLHELNPNHIKLLLTYGNFVKNVLNDITEGQRILEKADYVKRSMQANANFLGNDLMKYEGDTETCIVTCSANLHSLGNILNISAEIQRILQYTNSDLIGQSINQMMPNMIARLHDDFMRNYFETSKSVRVGRETVIYPMNKPGYIVPCAITVKVIPNLSDGLKMVGFLNELSQGKPSNPQEKGLSSFSSSAGYNKMHYILYGGENNVVHGVTESCFQAFGISSSLTLAQNIDFSEFTIDKIFPDLLLQNTQELRTGGLILKINTTALAQEYLAAKNSALLEEEDEATVQKRYREARVRVSLIEENVYDGGITLNIIKFAEFSDEVQISSKQEIAMPTSPGQIALKGKTIAAQGIDMNASQSDMSASSMSVVANEEDLILKDLKHQISAKKSPNVIIVLNRVSLLGAILLIVLMGLQLNKQTNNNDELKTALHVTRLSNERYNIIAELTLKVQMLDLLANNMISNANTIEQNEAELRYEIGTLVDQLSVVQFTTIQGRIDMQKENGEAVPSYSVQALLEDDTIADLVESYTNAVWVYVGAVQKVNNLALDALKDPIANYSVKDLLFYIKTNGLGVLQEGSETLTDSFIDFYASQTNSYIEFFLITSIIAFVLVLLFVLFVLFKIFSVNRTNIRVLSLFGYIPPNDIRELIDKCLQYLDAHQADIMVTEKNESYSEIQQEDQEKAVPTDKAEPSGLDDSKEVHSSRCEPIETEQDKGFDKTGDLMIQTQKQLHDRTIFETALEQSRSSLPLVTNAYPKDVNTTFGALENNKKPKRAESQDDKQDELLEELHEKSKNLANSKEYQKRGVIIQILIVCAIPTVYFALSLWLKIQSVDIFHSALDHMGVISEITVNLYYTTLFCLEEIIDPESLGSSISTSKASDEQSRQDFKQRVYANQQSLKSTGSLFPSQMDDYVTELTNFNNDDTCTLLYAEDPSQLAQCQSVDGSPYTGGLIQRELRLLDANDYALTKYFAVANRTVQTQIDMINGDNIQLTFQMIDRIDPAATEILDSFEASYSDCLHSMYVLAEIVSAVFAVVIFVILLFVWLPYLRRLTKQIIRTKSLMNVIPIQPLKKNKGLKEAFTSAGILAAMR